MIDFHLLQPIRSSRQMYKRSKLCAKPINWGFLVYCLPGISICDQNLFLIHGFRATIAHDGPTH